MSKNQLTGTATQPQFNREICQFNKDQYCSRARILVYYAYLVLIEIVCKLISSGNSLFVSGVWCMMLFVWFVEPCLLLSKRSNYFEYLVQYWSLLN